MAAITSANVVVRESYEVGSKQGKFVKRAVLCDVTLTAQGGTALDIPPSVFGLKTFTHVRCLAATISATQRLVDFGIANFGVPSTTYLYPVDPTQATDASRGLPSNITGVVTLYIEGQPA